MIGEKHDNMLALPYPLVNVDFSIALSPFLFIFKYLLPPSPNISFKKFLTGL